MNFFKSVSEALNNTDTGNLLRDGAKFVSNQLVAMQSTTTQVKIEKLSASTILKLIPHEEGKTFAVYTQSAGQHIILHKPSSYSIYKTSELNIAKQLFSQLNELIEFDQDASSSSLTKVAKVIFEHPEWRSIHFASALNCVQSIVEILGRGDPLVIVNTCTTEGEFPLNIAASYGYVEVINILVGYEATIDKRDSEGKTAVHVAAALNSDVLKALSEHPRFSATLNILDADDQTALGAAIRAENIESVQLLLAFGAADQNTRVPLWNSLLKCTAETKNLEEIVRLIWGMKPTLTCEKDAFGKTFLHCAENSKILELVLRFSMCPDMNIRDNQGLSGLHYAVLNNHLDIVILLLAYGADVDFLDGNGNTALFYSIKLGLPIIVKTLLLFNASQKQVNEAFTQCSAMGKKKDVALVLSALRTAAKPMTSGVHELIRQNHIALHLSFNEHRKIALSLDGGGIRGLVLIQMLLEIEAVGQISLMELVDWMAGTSTGAILALALSLGKSVADCQKIYFRFKDAVFSMMIFIIKYFHGRRPYSAHILESFLQAEYGENTKMADLKKNVIVTTAIANVKPAKLQLFRSYIPPLPADDLNKMGIIDPKQVEIWQAARCSSAAPSYFHSYKNKYLDGGLISNNPTCELLSEVQLWNVASQLKNESTIDLGCVLSLGTGASPITTVETIDVDASGAVGIVQSIGAIMHLKNVLIEQIAEADGVAVDRSRVWCESLGVPFFRFSPSLSKEVLLDETDNTTIINMMWETKLYMLENAEQILLLSDLLKSFCKKS